MRYMFLHAALLLCVSTLTAQQVTTATDFFDTVSQVYSQINNYTADIQITSKKDTLQGKVYFLAPNKIRIDFTNPAEQTIVSDGDIFSVYIPKHNVVLQQSLENNVSQAAPGLASGKGLSVLRKNYGIAYGGSPDLVPLEEGSSVLVRVLDLKWRSAQIGFRSITLYVNEQLLIQRITGITAYYQTVTIDYSNIQTNKGIPASMFTYDLPPSANIYENFLFNED